MVEKEKKITFSELLKMEPKPIRWEIDVRDRKFVLELENGEKIALSCDQCDSTTWDIGIMARENELHFRCICENGHPYFLTVGRQKK